MLDFITSFLDTHYWDVSYALSYTLGTICSITLLTRFLRMFPTYIKTGSLGNDSLGIFFSNKDYNGIHGWDFVKVKVQDFFTSTHPEPVIVDTLVCAFAILIMHMAWIVLVAVGVIATIVYGIVKFVQYLRNQHIKKEEFHAALKG